MKDRKNTDIIPVQETGKSIDAKSSIELAGEQQAKQFFTQVKERLQNVNQWKAYAGTLSASFQLVDQTGNEVTRNVEKGDYIKIDIPGPGSKSGDGFDWVQIEDIDSDTGPEKESFGFRVRPTANPQGHQQDTAHFYSQESTSSFIVERRGKNVTASVHDRNTKPNTDVDHVGDQVRDAVVGAVGVVSFSKIQWKNLTNGLLKLTSD